MTPTELSQYCTTLWTRLGSAGVNYADDFLFFALWIGAFSAVAELVLKVVMALRPAPPDGTAVPRSLSPDFLKGLAEALAKTPAWVALGLIGLALIWLAGATIDETCRVAPTKPGASTGAATGGAAGAGAGTTSGATGGAAGVRR